MVLEPPAPVPSSVGRFLTDYNPFYLLSACCMLFGIFAMNGSLDWSPLPMTRLLVMIVTLNLYEAMLIGLAVFLLRRGIRRDAIMLLIIEAFFLADVGFLNMEVFARDIWIGLIVNVFVLAAGALKVAVIFHAARIPLTDGRFAFVITQLGVLFAVPGIFAIVALPRDQHLPMLAIYGGWWLCGLLPVAYATLVGSVNTFRARADGQPATAATLISRAMLALPMLSLIAHLCLANWVYKVMFHPLNLAPLLLGLAVAVGHADCHVASLNLRVRLHLALPFVAVALSAIKFPRELIFEFAGTGLSPLRIVLAVAVLVYLDGLWLHRHVAFAISAAMCLMMAGLGHSVATINDNSIDMARSYADRFGRLIPRTLFAWGFVSVVASFMLLAAGAAISLLRREPGPIATDPVGDSDDGLA